MRSKKRLHPLIYLFMTGLIVYFVITFTRQEDEFAMIRSQMRLLQHRIDQEKETQENLLHKQSMTDSDEFIESIAREKLGMVKPGERLFINTD